MAKPRVLVEGATQLVSRDIVLWGLHQCTRLPQIPTHIHIETSFRINEKMPNKWFYTKSSVLWIMKAELELTKSSCQSDSLCHMWKDGCLVWWEFRNNGKVILMSWRKGINYDPISTNFSLPLYGLKKKKKVSQIMIIIHLTTQTTSSSLGMLL